MHRNQLALFNPQAEGDFRDEVAAFRYGGRPTLQREHDGLPVFVNEFWTARQRQGHPLHEISYRACFKPQLPEFFIRRLTEPGDTVYDPFMGRGTTPIQAVLMGRIAFGNDINPLSILLARPRTNPPCLQNVADRLGKLCFSASVDGHEELLVFYHPDTLREILALRSYLLERELEGSIDPIDDWIRMVALNRLTGHSPGFFSVYSLPPNQAVSVGAQAKINASRSQTPPRRQVADIILKKSLSLLKDGGPPRPAEARFFCGAAQETPGIPAASVDLIVTSPPFLDVVQYAQDNWLRCWFAGIAAGGVQISIHKKPEDWTAFVKDAFREFERVVRPGGHVAFEVGEVRNGKVELEKLVLKAIAPLNFEPLCVVINDQEFTKTANCWGVSNNTRGTNTNRIVVARRI